MLFAHDTEVALSAAAALVNTVQVEDELATIAALDDFVQAWGWTGQRRRTRVELDSVRALRPRLRSIWEVDEDSAVEIVNELLRQGHALPQLVKHDDWAYHVHATSPDAPLADRMAVEAALAFTDLIRSNELDRLQTCAGEDCDDVLVDLSKNRSRRYCSSSCGNRHHVSAFRARQADRHVMSNNVLSE